jgi:hypothetical protein
MIVFSFDLMVIGSWIVVINSIPFISQKTDLKKKKKKFKINK